MELPAGAADRAGIRTAPAEERVLAATLRTTGQVDFDRDRFAHVSPRVEGRIHRVEVALGESVRAGRKLASIDSIALGQTKTAYLQAKAAAELARTHFERAKLLLADGIVPEMELLEAEAELRGTTAGVHTAEETLRLYGLSPEQIEALSYEDPEASIHSLLAPFAGTVVERHATLGELVTPERNLFTLADLGRVWIWIDVYQRDLGRVHLGDLARARVDAFPEAAFTGTVSYLSAQVDADTRTVRARIDVENPEGRLRPGMFVEVELVDPHAEEGRGTLERCLAVPESALVRQGDALFAFVAAGEHRFERRLLETGRRSGGWVEVVAGIRLGEPVVVEGAFLLKSAAARESLGGSHAH